VQATNDRKEIGGMQIWRCAALVPVLAVALGCVIPGPADAQWGATRAKQENLSALAAAATDTSNTFDISQLTDITVFLQYDGDSAKVAIDYSVDGSTWNALVTATQCNGTPNTDAVQYVKALVVGDAAGSGYSHGFIGNSLRFRLTNDDSATALADVKYIVKGRK
jgi:hypothetical protein